MAFRPQSPDETGTYCVTHWAQVNNGIELNSNKVAMLDVGTVAELMQIVVRPDLKRVRAQIAQPYGWITLRNLESGQCFADAVGDVRPLPWQSDESCLISSLVIEHLTVFSAWDSPSRVGNFNEGLVKLEDAVMCILGKSNVASRKYREAFDVTYRRVFGARMYHRDILNAAFMKSIRFMYVNGDTFELSNEALLLAEKLRRAWLSFLSRLQCTRSCGTYLPPTRIEFTAVLRCLDESWADFERVYMTELMTVEAKVRLLVADAIDKEERLHVLEKLSAKKQLKAAQDPDFREGASDLVKCLGCLNVRANVNGHGRDDLGADILLNAMAALDRCTEDGAIDGCGCIAVDVVKSFTVLRTFLRSLKTRLMDVSPSLHTNVGLRTRLEAWEEMWEKGARYLQDGVFDAICDVVTQIRAAERLVPEIEDMCNDCDVEFFLALPRLVWLRFLFEPAKQIWLLKSLLPHRFQDTVGVDSFPALIGDDLGSLMDMSKHIVDLLGHQMAFKILLKRIIRRPDAGDTCDDAVPGPALPVLAALMRELEKYSMELQRHRPDEWNQFTAVIVRCLHNTCVEEKTSAPSGALVP
jgi:hypothetical protein